MRILHLDTIVKPLARWGQLRRYARRPIIIILIFAVWLAPIIAAVTWVHVHPSNVPASSPSVSTLAVASAIAHYSQTTPARYDFTVPAGSGSSARVAIDGYFTLYYAAHDGSELLGPPLAPAFPITGGWVQFFLSGALIYPTQQGPAPAATSAATSTPATTSTATATSASHGTPAATSTATAASAPSFFAGGVHDAATGIIRLSLVQPLLRAGSLVTIAGDDTPTYADLRRAVTPVTLATTHGSAGSVEPVFTYRENGQSHTGQIIPKPIWQYITRSSIAPNGWQADIGLPLTLPVIITVHSNDGTHQLQVQCFEHAALVEDDGVPGKASTPVVAPLPTGLAYAQTLGMPAVNTAGASQAWVTGNTTVLDAPGTGHQRAQIGTNFPVTLTGDTRWIGDDLWYAIQWTGQHTQGNGWLRDDVLSFLSPGTNAPAWSSFDTLSPDLASYLRGLGGDTGAAIYDETRHRYYTYNVGTSFIMASSSKVPIMITFLQMTERQQREPNANEMALLTAMIEQSDNDAAEALWLAEGGAPAVAAMVHALGISGLNPDVIGEWGYSTVSPLAMVQLLTALHDGKVLTAQDRALALNLMSHIEPDQQRGVGVTAPQGASYWMKDGWVTAPNGLWAVNSSGIVTLGSETYIISVYSQNKATLDEGWEIAEQVCGTAGKLLTS